MTIQKPDWPELEPFGMHETPLAVDFSEIQAASEMMRCIDAVVDAVAALCRSLERASSLHDTPEPYYITEFRQIASAKSTLPHVREAITSALAAYDARTLASRAGGKA